MDLDPPFLLAYPDTTSADIELKFNDYSGDDPEDSSKSLFSFSLNYDYNLYDDEGVLKKDNNYSVRMDVTYDSPSGGKKLTSKQLRKRGDVEVPPSILKEGKYTYTKFEIASRGSVEQDVSDYLDEEFAIYDSNVSDSYQIQAMYSFFNKRFLEVTSDVGQVKRTIAANQQEIRNYFANNAAFDKISSGFFERIAKSITTGRSDLPLADGVDSEPGFLEPPETELSEEEQTRKESQRAGTKVWWLDGSYQKNGAGSRRM